MMATFLNLAGFGMVAWDPRSAQAEDPFTYRVTTLRPSIETSAACPPSSLRLA